MSSLSIKSLLVPSKNIEVEYPGLEGFLLNITYLSRESLANLRKKCTKTVFKGNKQSVDFDSDLFLKLYTQATIVGWTGLKVKYLSQLAPIEMGDVDPEAEIAFSEDNALYLIKSSADFDNYISEFVSDLGNFSKTSSTA